jgi:tetratricopeptide (TPR) repeat protein
MGKRVLFVGFFLFLALGPFFAATPAQQGRVGCPQCKNDSSETARLLEEADLLYSAFKTKETLQVLTRVLEIDPRNHEAMAKSARVYLDFGDAVPESDPQWREKKIKHYATAERYARQAIEADRESTWGHFYLAASLGKTATVSPISRQLELAPEIRAAAEKAIALDPSNGYAYHVYGVWHRRLAEIGQMQRFLATTLFWRSVPQGSLDKSVELLRKAASLNPRVIIHQLELAKTYVATGKFDLARQHLQRALELPIQFSDDPQNKKEADKILHEIKDR